MEYEEEKHYLSLCSGLSLRLEKKKKSVDLTLIFEEKKKNVLQNMA